MKKWNMSLYALWRTKWLILLFVVLLLIFQFVSMPNSTGRLVVYKLALAVVGCILGHIIVKELYPYIDLRRLVYPDKEDEHPDAIKFLGACLLRGLVMSAIVVGILLGV